MPQGKDFHREITYVIVMAPSVVVGTTEFYVVTMRQAVEGAWGEVGLPRCVPRTENCLSPDLFGDSCLTAERYSPVVSPIPQLLTRKQKRKQLK